jgi:tetratricopeptide (TPR) repeat protein
MIRVATLLLLAVAAPVWAEDIGVPEKARLLAERGRALHDAGDYAGAIAAYKEAYVLAPRPGLLFNLAQAYRLSGDCDDAAFMYRRFLESNPTEDRRAIAEANLATVSKCGHGGLALVVAQPAPAPMLAVSKHAPAGPEPAPSTAMRDVGTYLAVGGAAALVVAGGFAYEAHQASDEVTQAYNNGMTVTNLSQQDASGRRDATIAEVAAGVGGAAAITGAILIAVGLHEEAGHVAISPNLHGGEVKLSWTF